MHLVLWQPPWRVSFHEFAGWHFFAKWWQEKNSPGAIETLERKDGRIYKQDKFVGKRGQDSIHLRSDSGEVNQQFFKQSDSQCEFRSFIAGQKDSVHVAGSNWEFQIDSGTERWVEHQSGSKGVAFVDRKVMGEEQGSWDNGIDWSQPDEFPWDG